MPSLLAHRPPFREGARSRSPNTQQLQTLAVTGSRFSVQFLYGALAQQAS